MLGLGKARLDQFGSGVGQNLDQKSSEGQNFDLKNLWVGLINAILAHTAIQKLTCLGHFKKSYLAFQKVQRAKNGLWAPCWPSLVKDMLGQVSMGYVRIVQVRLGQVWLGQVRLGQGST